MLSSKEYRLSCSGEMEATGWEGRVNRAHPLPRKPTTTLGEHAWQTFTRHKRQNKRRLGAKQLKTLRPIALQRSRLLPLFLPPPPLSLSLVLSTLPTLLYLFLFLSFSLGPHPIHHTRGACTHNLVAVYSRTPFTTKTHERCKALL